MVVEKTKESYNNQIDGVVIYGKYGTALVPLKLNADGELVVNLEAATVNIGDVDIASPLGRKAGAESISSALSTEDVVFLTAIQDRLGALTTPAAGSANKQLADIQADIAAIRAILES